MSLPFLGGRNGLCQILEPLVGKGVEEPNMNWEVLSQSVTNMAKEVPTVWKQLQGEAKECGDYLGDAMEGILGLSVGDMGQGMSDGSIRRLITEQMEALHTRALAKGLQEHPEKTARPVWDSHS